MKLSQEILDQVQDLAGRYMTPRAIAIIIGVDEDDFRDELEDEDSQVYKHFYRGLYMTEAELQGAIIRLAKQGSSPAQALALKLQQDAKTSM